MEAMSEVERLVLEVEARDRRIAELIEAIHQLSDRARVHIEEIEKLSRLLHSGASNCEPDVTIGPEHLPDTGLPL